MKRAWHWLEQLPLLHGTVPVVLTVGAALGLVVLVVARGHRRWFTRSVPVAVAIAGMALIGIWVALIVLKPFPDALPPRVFGWIGAGLLALALAALAWRHQRWWRRGALVVAAALVLLGAADQINLVYGPFPTIAAALQVPPSGAVPASTVLQALPNPAPIVGAVGAPVEASWTPPAGMPTTGALTQVDIPATASRFTARPTWIYVPPAYLTTRRPLLPVLVLISGQPGSPRDWIDAGAIATHMDAFAAAHHGLAPVVVMPDALGAETANPMCLDSQLGNTDTYLSQDVPHWVTSTLQVDPDTAHWAIGGFSYGGTCALQLAVAHPTLFPTFLDISGQRAPTLGDPTLTLTQAFGAAGPAQRAAFAAVNPMQELAAHPLHGSAAWLAVGAADTEYGPQAATVRAALVAAGVDVQGGPLPGGHSWTVAVEALVAATPWIAQRAGLTS